MLSSALYCTVIVKGPLACTEKTYIPSPGIIIVLAPPSGLNGCFVNKPHSHTDAPSSWSRSPKKVASPW